MKYVIDDLRSVYLNKFLNIPLKISIDILFQTIIVRIVILADNNILEMSCQLTSKLKSQFWVFLHPDTSKATLDDNAWRDNCYPHKTDSD